MLTAELRAEQQQIAQRATAEMLALFGALQFKAIDATAPAFIEASVSVADRYHREASALGGDMYLSMRRDAGIVGHFAVARPEFDDVQLRRDLVVLGPVSAKKLMGQGVRIQDAAKSVFTLTSGRVATAALAGSRDTLSRSANADRQAVAYARQTASGACDFCLLMAENTYKDAYSALYASGTRKRAKAAQPMGSKFHDHCRCTLFPLFRGGPVTDVLAKKRASAEDFRNAWLNASGQGATYREFLTSRGQQVSW